MRAFTTCLALLLLGPSVSFGVDLGKGVLRISADRDREFIVPTPPSLKDGHHVLVVRPREDDGEPEVIANGRLRAGPVWRIEIDWDRLKKRPNKGDYVVPLGAPKQFASKDEKKPRTNTDFGTDEIPVVEPGYIRLGYTSWDAKLQSSNPDTGNHTGSLKNIPRYGMTGFELEWFLDFVPNYGLTLAQTSHAVPVKTYWRDDADAKSSRTDLRFHYRNTKVKTPWRWVATLATRSDEFATDNPDEWLLPGTVMSILAGGSFAYERGDALYTAPSTSLQWHTLGASALYAMAVNATDSGVKRGTSSGGSKSAEMRLFTEWTLYLPWMPYIKRSFFRVEYVTEDLNLKFSGETANPVTNNYTIPEGGQYREQRQGLLMTFGFRFEDAIGRIFKPRN